MAQADESGRNLPFVRYDKKDFSFTHMHNHTHTEHVQVIRDTVLLSTVGIFISLPRHIAYSRSLPFFLIIAIIQYPNE